MHITQLHALARRELVSLAHARYMPRGYDRQASQKADRKHYELSKYLDAVLATTPDRLMQSPTGFQLKELHAQAAQERTLQAMVAKMVALLRTLPEMDQGDAYALADINDRLFSAQSIRSRLDSTRADFDKLAEHAARLEVDLGVVYAALQDLETQVTRKVDILEENQRRLTETP